MNEDNYISKIYIALLGLYCDIFGRSWALPLNRFIYNLALRGLGIQNYKGFKYSGENRFIEVFYKINADKKELLVIDVGANKGDYVKLLLEKNRNKNLQIIAIEPDPTTFKRLTKNFLGQKIKLLNYACDEKNGRRFFYSDNIGEGLFSSFYKGVENTVENLNSSKIKVNTIKLDEIINREKIKNVNLLKVDTEGSEIEVLRGCIHAIRNNKVELIQFEFNSMNLSTRVFLKDFLLFLKEYSFYRLLPHGIIKLEKYNSLFWEIFAYQNIVAVRKDIVKKFENNYE